LLDPGTVDVVTGPASRTVVPLATVKSQLGISGAADDARLSALIQVAAVVIAGEAGLKREPWRQTVLIRTPGFGGTMLPLPVWPIESVSSVTEGTGDSPTAVDATTYAVRGRAREILYRSSGWSRSLVAAFAGNGAAGLLPLTYNVTCTAGYVMPDQVGDWATGVEYAAGAFARPSASTNRLLYECTTGGTSGGAEPAWPATAGETVTDGTVVWTAREATEWPKALEEAAYLCVSQWWLGGLEVPVGVTEERWGPMAVRYSAGVRGAPALAIPSAAKALLAAGDL